MDKDVAAAGCQGWWQHHIALRLMPLCPEVRSCGYRESIDQSRLQMRDKNKDFLDLHWHHSALLNVDVISTRRLHPVWSAGALSSEKAAVDRHHVSNRKARYWTAKP